jgi:hypothetical protein
MVWLGPKHVAHRPTARDRAELESHPGPTEDKKAMGVPFTQLDKGNAVQYQHGVAGVAVEGPVGSCRIAGLRLFPYEVRCWRDGVIPDAGEAVASPQPLSDDLGRARRLLDLVASVPALIWGRDELGTGEMWNSN